MANYVNNKEFHELLIEYKKTQSRRSYEKLGAIFLKIAQHMIQKLNFINYSSDRHDEFISLACLYCLRYLKNYDPVKYSNPFAFFSQIIFNSFLQCINANKIRDTLFVSIDYLISKDAVNTSENYNCDGD